MFVPQRATVRSRAAVLDAMLRGRFTDASLSATATALGPRLGGSAGSAVVQLLQCLLAQLLPWRPRCAASLEAGSSSRCAAALEARSSSRGAAALEPLLHSEGSKELPPPSFFLGSADPASAQKLGAALGLGTVLSC